MAVIPLVDHLGRQINFANLKKDVAAPSMMGVRSIVTGHPAEGLTPQRLARILRGAEDGDAISYLELAEQMEEKDLHYRSVLGTRKLAVTQLKITVEPASDNADDAANAELIADWLKRDELEEELFDILDAVGKGYSHTEIVWETSAKQWMPTRLEWRDPRWFRFDIIDGVTPMLRDIEGFLPLEPYKWIYHRSKTKSGLPVRAGLARPVAWAWMFKNYSVKDWVAFAEVFGMPLRVGKYQTGETQENIRLLMQAVANMGTDAAAVIANSMEIEFVDAAKGSGAAPGELYEKLANFFDTQISKAVLGQTATTDAIAGGHAVGKTHNEVRGDLKRSDKNQLQATLNRDLVKAIVFLNRGPPAGGAYPRIIIDEEDDPLEVGAMGNVLAQLVPLGLKVKVTEVRQRMAFTDPTEEDEVLAAPAPTPADKAEGPSLGQEGQAGEEDDAASGRAGRQEGGAATLASASDADDLSRLSKPLGDHRKGVGTADAIDRAIDQALSDWKPLAEPLVKPVEQLVAGATSLEQIRDRLAGAIDDMSVDQIAELLAQAGFKARLSGMVGEGLD